MQCVADRGTGTDGLFGGRLESCLDSMAGGLHFLWCSQIAESLTPDLRLSREFAFSTSLMSSKSMSKMNSSGSFLASLAPYMQPKIGWVCYVWFVTGLCRVQLKDPIAICFSSKNVRIPTKFDLYLNKIRRLVLYMHAVIACMHNIFNSFSPSLYRSKQAGVPHENLIWSFGVEYISSSGVICDSHYDPLI